MPDDTDRPDLDLLQSIQRRVLWLATRMVDHANHERANPDGMKVGGHQASSASLVTVMTALWFAHLNGADRVSVKPHASPVLHAINYLLGDLDRTYLTGLRQFGGLQSYPSRTKDPDRVDFSTGSVGLGAAAPLFAAAVRRYVDAHFGARERSRFIALIGDAELDEGNVWEAIADPASAGLGDVMWIVDFNRQSLDRVIPGVRIEQWTAQFAAAGWHVVEVKYGQRLRAAFDQPGGEALRDWLDVMPNEQYQSVFGLPPADARARFLDGAPSEVVEVLAEYDDELCVEIVTDLGGHDMAALLDAFAECDAETERPSVVFAYTVKGFGLPIAGHPRNHSALLTTGQVDALRESMGLTRDTEWDGFDVGGSEGDWCRLRQAALRKPHARTSLTVSVPTGVGLKSTGSASTQEAFGRVLSRPGPRRGPASVPRDDRTGCRHVDESRRVHQPCRRVRARESASVERGPGAEVGGGPHRPAPRAGHQRDEPVHDARCPGPVRGAERSAAAADRHGLRPVRPAWTRCLRARGVLRRPVHRRRALRRA